MFSFMPKITAVFSDIDGTIVHYEKTLKLQGYELADESNPVAAAFIAALDNPLGLKACAWYHRPSSTYVPCFAVPSLTLGGGYISAKTLDLVNSIRALSVQYVLMTGARTSTLLMRRKSGTLPCSDYDVGEGGGKIWPREGHPPHIDVKLEESWSAQFIPITGPLEQLDLEPSERRGLLWECYMVLKEAGYHLDAVSMSTSFLVDLSKSTVITASPASSQGHAKSVDYAEAELKAWFNVELGPKYGVTYITNLGKGQVCPVGCNKLTAMQYVLRKHGLQASDAVAFFDDENDLAFAGECGAGFLPSVAHGSVLKVIADKKSAGQNNWFRPTADGLLGTEEGLEAVLRRVEEAQKSRL